MPYLSSLPILQLRHDAILLYYEPQYSHSKSAKWKQRKLNNFKEKKGYTGTVTRHTKKRISKAINIMLQTAEQKIIFNPVSHRKEKFKINFITLTISSKERHITANEGYTMLLKPFLKWLTKTKSVNTYIWKAELQKNGQLHYHITTTTWIHWKEIRNKWNYLLAKNGMLKQYAKEHKHANANSTDVHKVYKIRNLSAYLHKELCKSIQNIEATRGKIWDCSNNLKGQNYFKVEFDEEHEKLLLKASRKMTLVEYQDTQFTLIRGNKYLSRMMLNKNEAEEYSKWISDIRRQNTFDFQRKSKNTNNENKSVANPLPLPKKVKDLFTQLSINEKDVIIFE